MNTVRLDGMRFVNESGNQVLFHGINVLARDRKDGHLYPWIYQAMPYFQRSGFNLIRLGIFWDGAEPEPGKIDYGYLEKLTLLGRSPLLSTILSEAATYSSFETTGMPPVSI